MKEKNGIKSINKKWSPHFIAYPVFLLFPFLAFGQLSSIHTVNDSQPANDTSLFAYSDVQVKPEFPKGGNEMNKFLEESIYVSSSINK